MATRRNEPPAEIPATKTARSTAKTAGKPKKESATRSRSVPQRPDVEELDLRDRLKSGPRRQAGPVLVGDTQRLEAMTALRNEVVPDPTDPV
jgi:hypothetical protein